MCVIISTNMFSFVRWISVSACRKKNLTFACVGQCVLVCDLQLGFNWPWWSTEIAQKWNGLECSLDQASSGVITRSCILCDAIVNQSIYMHLSATSASSLLLVLSFSFSFLFGFSPLSHLRIIWGVTVRREREGRRRCTRCSCYLNHLIHLFIHSLSQHDVKIKR